MPANQPFHLERRDRPIVISIPHLGTVIPEALQPRYTSEAMTLQDTDWHLDRLYDFAGRLGATVISAKMSRYVIDVNRAPNGESLYPGMTTTSLCPTETLVLALGSMPPQTTPAIGSRTREDARDKAPSERRHSPAKVPLSP